ncbi:MAG: carboxypeptidase regulatory-like domain-containing protein [Bacteroidetes bacterium]|nr:carboxypeptidase regulatory-like domain-containing protein [Bacteroidota bacterium]
MKIFKITVAFACCMVAANLLSAQPALKRANKQYELAAFSVAVQSYKEFLSKNPDHVEANSKIADCYRHLNQQEKALPHYQAAVASAEVEDMFVFQYGLTLQELARYELAQKVFNSLGEKSPEFKTRCKQFSEACQFAIQAQDSPLFKVSNEYANTASFDFGPAFLGDRVVYSSGRTDIRGRDSRNVPAPSDGSNRLFVTQRDRNGFLDVPTTLHTGFGALANEGPAAYTSDGSDVAVTRNNFSDGTRIMPSSGLEMNLFLAQADENGDWENAAPFAHNGADFSTGFPNFSPDGKALFFTSNRPGGYGGFDLYVSYRVGSNWSAPENLGSTVNSLGNEITPFYDGSSLYFASDFHKGFGGFDIFRAEDSGGRWATVYHAGSGLNSSVDDFGFVFDAARNIGYFVSNRPGGKGAEDIYRIQKETESVVIKVTDALTGAAIAGATVDFSSCGEKSYQTNGNGIFNFQLLEKLDCSATVSKDGFLSETIKITTLGLRESRTVTVALANSANSYMGKVINGSNGNATDNVKVIATNQANKTETTTYSTANGSYAIALQPNATYVIRYSKAGYRDLSFNFKTSTADKKNIQDIELLPVGVGTPVTSAPKEPAVTSMEQPVTTPGATTRAGFSVQLAAGTSPKVDLKPYEAKMSKSGVVYTVNEGGKTKVRFGVFATREEAVAAQAVAKENGYAGAFVVAENAGPAAPLNKTSGAKTSSPKSIETKPEATPAAATKEPESLDGYLVKLAAYRDMNNFKQSSIEDLGVVKFVKKGDFTIVLLSGYDSKSSAEIGLQKARNRGFPGAYMVTMDKGELVKQ